MSTPAPPITHYCQKHRLTLSGTQCWACTQDEVQIGFEAAPRAADTALTHWSTEDIALLEAAVALRKAHGANLSKLHHFVGLLLLLGALTGCASDYASPFDQPDETTQPVTCGAGCQQ